MSGEQMQPSEKDNIDCHLQDIGMGTLLCRAARQRGDKTTNEVSPVICFRCPAGKVFREVGCDAVLPRIRIFPFDGGGDAHVDNLFCKIRKRDTTLEYCQTCDLVTAETTRRVVSSTRGLFQAQDFYSAYKDLEKARESIRDGNFENCITRSIASLESTMRICMERLGKPLPKGKQVTDLWKCTRDALKFDAIDPTGTTSALVNSLTGAISHLGGMRNALGDAHGKGIAPPAVSESMAELAINTASTLSTVIVRRFSQVEGEKE